MSTAKRSHQQFSQLRRRDNRLIHFLTLPAVAGAFLPEKSTHAAYILYDDTWFLLRRADKLQAFELSAGNRGRPPPNLSAAVSFIHKAEFANAEVRRRGAIN